MAFHLTNLGKYSHRLKQYADLNGYVPEAGDDWRDHRWDGAIEWTDELWAEHVEGAVRAAHEAEAQRLVDGSEVYLCEVEATSETGSIVPRRVLHGVGSGGVQWALALYGDHPDVYYRSVEELARAHECSKWEMPHTVDMAGWSTESIVSVLADALQRSEA